MILSFLLVILVLGVSRMAHIKSQMEEVANINNVHTKLASTMYLTITERALAIGSIQDRMLILLDIEKLMSSAEMGLVAPTLQ